MVLTVQLYLFQLYLQGHMLTIPKLWSMNWTNCFYTLINLANVYMKRETLIGFLFLSQLVKYLENIVFT